MEEELPTTEIEVVDIIIDSDCVVANSICIDEVDAVEGYCSIEVDVAKICFFVEEEECNAVGNDEPTDVETSWDESEVIVMIFDELLIFDDSPTSEWWILEGFDRLLVIISTIDDVGDEFDTEEESITGTRLLGNLLWFSVTIIELDSGIDRLGVALTLGADELGYGGTTEYTTELSLIIDEEVFIVSLVISLLGDTLIADGVDDNNDVWITKFSKLDEGCWIDEDKVDVLLLVGGGDTGVGIVDGSFIIFVVSKTEDFVRRVVWITDVVDGDRSVVGRNNFVVVDVVAVVPVDVEVTCGLQISFVSIQAFILQDVSTEGNLESALAVVQQHTSKSRPPLLFIRRDAGNISKALLEIDDTIPNWKFKLLRLLSPLKVSSVKCSILLLFKIKTSRSLRFEKAPSANFNCREPWWLRFSIMRFLSLNKPLNVFVVMELILFVFKVRVVRFAKSLKLLSSIVEIMLLCK